jgi:DNA-directed RNA polymerase beta subunit
MINELINCSERKIIDERFERDNLCNKRLEPAGLLCAELFRQMFNKYCQLLIKEMEKKVINPNVRLFVQKNNVISKKFITCFMNASWGAQQNGYVRIGVSQILSNVNHLSILSHLQRVSIPVTKDTKNLILRQLHPSHLFYICGCESPEGNTIGLVLNLTSGCRISTRSPLFPLINFLKKIAGSSKLDTKGIKLLINGVAVCNIVNLEKFSSQFKNFRNIH